MNIINSILIVILIGLTIMGGLIFSKSSPHLANQLTSSFGYDQANLNDAVSFNLNSTSRTWGQSGVVNIENDNGDVQLNVDLKDNQNLNDVEQPAYIKIGTCARPQKTIFQLNKIVNGKSETDINISLMELKNNSPLVLHVYKSDKEANILTSCGELKIDS